MAIGLSTYSYFWQWHQTADRPLTLVEMVDRTAGWDVGLFQICDYPALEDLDRQQLRQLAAAASRRQVALELGTRGVDADHLARYLELAQRLGATLVRSMVRAYEVPGAVDQLRAAVPAYEQAGVSLALETYEQIPTPRLLEVVSAVDSPRLGICLDPGNCVAALEHPRSTIDLVADRVLNLHVKDFAFARQPGWVGFTLAGALLGEGLLDLDHLMQRVRPTERGINAIVEHWLVWQGDTVSTCALEDTWTLHALAVLRRHEASSPAPPDP